MRIGRRSKTEGFTPAEGREGEPGLREGGAQEALLGSVARISTPLPPPPPSHPPAGSLGGSLPALWLGCSAAAPPAGVISSALMTMAGRRRRSRSSAAARCLASPPALLRCRWKDSQARRSPTWSALHLGGRSNP